MRTFLLSCFLVGMSAALGASSSVVNQSVTGTVKISGIEVAKNQFLITPKKGYVHILWDAFPNRAAIKAAGTAFKLEEAVAEVIKNKDLGGRHKSKAYKVDVVEFSQKDSYGSLDWKKVNFLGRFEAKLNGKQWVVKKKAAE